MLKASEVENMMRQRKTSVKSYVNIQAMLTADGENYAFLCDTFGCRDRNNRNGCFVGKEWPKELVEGKEGMISCYGCSSPLNLVKNSKPITFRALYRYQT